jgi:hypothetical protein
MEIETEILDLEGLGELDTAQRPLHCTIVKSIVMNPELRSASRITQQADSPWPEDHLDSFL